MSRRRRLLLVHQFPLQRVSGVTVMIAELLRILPTVCPDLEVEYLCLDEVGPPERLADVMMTSHRDVSCVCGVNLHIERSWDLTRALAEWGRGCSVRCVLYAHDYWPHLRDAVGWLTGEAGWALLASTEHVRRELHAAGFDAALAEVGVPLAHVRTSCTGTRPGGSVPIIASSGRLVPRKRFRDLVCAFCLRGLHERARLFLGLNPSLVYSDIQDQAQLDELLAIANEGGAPVGSIVINRRPAMVSDYTGHAMYVAPSSYEGFGMTPIEAAWSGCPPILSNIPPHRETAEALFGKAAAAFLYPVGDACVLARLLDDELRTGWRREWLAARRPGIQALIERRWSLRATARRLAELA